MLNRSQIHTMLMLRNRGNNLFSKLPIELIREISEFGQTPNSDFAKAIKHVARGEVSEVKTMLDKASSMKDKTKLKELLLSSGTAITRCGLIVKHKTLLECALGDGDPSMIKLINSYFPLFPNGNKEMQKQLERYRFTIEASKNQTPESLTWLFEIIKKSPLIDVKIEFGKGSNYDLSYQSELRIGLKKFREQKLDAKLRVVSKPQMHCNYQNLAHAYDMLRSSWSELKEWDHAKQTFNYDKCHLVARQVIGFIQLVELPACERFLFARGQVKHEVTADAIELESNVLNYKHNNDSFPDYEEALIKSHSGFGFESYSSLFGGCRWGRCDACLAGVDVCGDSFYKNYVEEKTTNLQDLYRNMQTEKQPFVGFV